MLTAVIAYFSVSTLRPLGGECWLTPVPTRLPERPTPPRYNVLIAVTARLHRFEVTSQGSNMPEARQPCTPR
jgi:hypothetical protein